METPPRKSSTARVAAFLAGVGENNMFTKMQLLNAVPETSQAERRMRDLRAMGWIIENYKTNHHLKPEHYLVRRIGTRVDLGERRQTTLKNSKAGVNMNTECSRCAGPSATTGDGTADAEAVYRLTHDVGDLDAKERLLEWMTLGRRTSDSSELAFNEWACLPADKRLEVLTRLAHHIAEEKQREAQTD